MDMKRMMADCAIVGGSAMERTIYACKLRRLGIATFSELKNRKKPKMFKRACLENRYGRGGVYDLDDSEDRAWLDRSDLPIVGV